MTSQSHTFSKETVEHLPTIKKIADVYGVSLRDLLGHSRTLGTMDARAALVKALRDKGLSYNAIGRVVNRDHSTVRQLLMRLSGAPRKERRMRDNIAARSETERMSTDMLKRGSAALLLAIFAAGKSYRPMSPAEVLAATEWAKKFKGLRPVGWME